MLSRASLLFILKSGCLNSHACAVYQTFCDYDWVQEPCTYARAVRRLAVFLIVVPDLVKVVLVQLTDETGEVAMLEMLWQNVLCEFFVLIRVSGIGLKALNRKRSPRARRSCRPRCPIGQRFRPGDSPTSCYQGQWVGRARGVVLGDRILVELANLLQNISGASPETEPLAACRDHHSQSRSSCWSLRLRRRPLHLHLHRLHGDYCRLADCSSPCRAGSARWKLQWRAGARERKLEQQFTADGRVSAPGSGGRMKK